MKRYLPLIALFAALPALDATGPPAPPPADLIVHNARVVTLDAKSRIARAVAVRDGKIVAIGDDKAILKLKGPTTKVIDAGGRTVLPGLSDSHTHPLDAATSELAAPLPDLKSLPEVFAHIKNRPRSPRKASGSSFATPSRRASTRRAFPTRAELDKAAPDHPVLYHAGPAGIVNTQGLKVSDITRDTPNPSNGVIVKDDRGEPTGMLRNAYGALKGLPRDTAKLSPKAKREAVKKLFSPLQ